MRRQFRPLIPVAAALLVSLFSQGAVHAADLAAVDTHRGTYTDWSAFEAAPAEPFHVKACGTTVRVTFPVDHGMLRTREDDLGNTYLDFQGEIKQRLIAKDGRRSHLIDISGIPASGGFVSYPDGAFLFDGLGASSLFNSARLPGLPKNFVSQGPITILYNADGSMELLRSPQEWISVCALLNGAYQPGGDHVSGGYTDWSDWQDDPAGDSEYVRGCGTQVKFHPTDETVQSRFRADEQGNVYVQFGNGDLIGRFVAKDGRRSDNFDLSGEVAPGGIVIYSDSTQKKPHFLADLLGVNYTLPVAGVGIDTSLPRLNVTYGPVTAISADNKLTALREPQQAVNICHLLNGGDLPWVPAS